jgi:hypothetical protein
MFIEQSDQSCGFAPELADFTIVKCRGIFEAQSLAAWVDVNAS